MIGGRQHGHQVLKHWRYAGRVVSVVGGGVVVAVWWCYDGGVCVVLWLCGVLVVWWLVVCLA